MALFQKAVRRQVKLRAALIGPSGSGKTYSALLLCKGMGGRTALLDTEKGRGLHYADEKDGPLAGFEYDYLRLDPPYEPEAFIKLIEAAELEGIENLVIDSISHEWNGKGGCLDIHSRMPGNSYMNWNIVTPRHDSFINAITMSGLNVFATLRAKDEYVLETNEKGKVAPKKVGMGAEQRKGFEFECELAFMLDQKNHVAETMKDNTHIFEGRYEVLTEEHGRKIKEWANSGDAESKPASYSSTQPQTNPDSSLGPQSLVEALRERIKGAQSKDNCTAIWHDIVGNKDSIPADVLVDLKAQCKDKATSFD